MRKASCSKRHIDAWSNKRTRLPALFKGFIAFLRNGVPKRNRSYTGIYRNNGNVFSKFYLRNNSPKSISKTSNASGSWVSHVCKSNIKCASWNRRHLCQMHPASGSENLASLLSLSTSSWRRRSCSIAKASRLMKTRITSDSSEDSLRLC